MKSHKQQSPASRIAELEKELEIEAAMDRIRARALAMHSSGELIEVADVLREQMALLGRSDLETTAVQLYDDNSAIIESLYAFRPSYGPEGKSVSASTTFPKDSCELVREMLAMYRSPATDYTLEVGGTKRQEWLEVLQKAAPEIVEYAIANKEVFPEITYFHFSDFRGGTLLTVSYKPPSNEVKALLRRAASVFDLAYRRFTDLQKAESQAREAQIETALEKVRSKAMAMHDSNDLSSAVSMVFTELKKLGIKPIRCGVGLFTKDPPRTLLYTATISNDSDTLDLVGWVDVVGHPVLEKIFDSWLNQEDYFPVLNGKELKTYYKKLSHGLHIPSIPDGRSDEKQYGHFLPFPEGMLNAWAERPYSEPELKILDRFKSIISLTFRRYLDLKKAEEQARESQIQLGLERVRAKAMAMQTSEELNELIGTVFGELTKLDFVLTRCLIMIFNPETNSSRWWMANSEASSEPMNYLVQYHKNPAYAAYLKAWKARDLKWRYALKGKVKRDWDNFLFVETELSLLPDFVIAGMKAPEQVLLSASFNNFGCLTLVTLEPMSDEHSDIMLRFAKVFDMSYTRFNDLKQAEAQAKESQIQLALERVRARTMAMQKSEELAETAAVLFQQLLNLGISSERTFIGMPNDDTRKIELWGTEQGGHQMSMRFEYEADATYAFREIYKAWLEKRSEFTVILKGKNLDEHVNYVRNVLHMPILVGLVQQQRMLYNAFFSKGLLMIVTPETQSKETLEILQRFAGVFDGTYTRFLDLQKAEAQGRESQIQLALERVRARTMAMQKSDELVETAMTLFQQFSDLGVEPERIFIGNMDENTRMIEFWGIDLGGKHPRFEINADATIGFSQIYKAWKAKKKTHTVIMKGQELADHVRYVEDVLHMSMQPELVQRQRIMYSAFFSKGLLMIVTPEIQCNETLEILERFAGVFDGTYTRFLDLQKAEAQGRESQIQLALERVRARTMAMQKSEELAETATVLFQQLLNLGISAERTIIGLPKDDTGKIEFWGTEQGGNQISTRFEYEADATYAFREIYKAWQEKRSELTVILKGKNLEEHVNYVRNVLHMPILVGLVQQQRMLYNAFFSKGLLMIVTPETQSKETLEILQRFAGVFDGTYTRFLDLQKAEAQGRESQIQLALERVRARTMAMQKSDELVETAMTLFQQFSDLGVEPERIFIGNMDENTRMIEFWGIDLGGKHPRFEINADATIGFSQIYKAWKAKKKTHTVIMKGQELADHVRYVEDVLHMSMQPELVQRQRIMYSAFFSKGLLMIVTPEIQCNETLEILERFAGVFDGTYTRFLDLQKAEAQGRESQIQLALERVRARTMAMQKSEELAETATVLFQQLLNLGISAERTIIGLPKDDTGKIEFWGTEQGGNQISTRFEYEADATYAFREIYKAWQEKRSELTVILKGKNLEEHVNYVRNVLHVPLLAGLVQKQRMLYNAFFSKGWLEIVTPEAQSKETLDILQRFAGVFDGTYTRFLDLQKAEAQARDAKIEASLERVRSKTMAMHNSQDVGETVAVMFDELVKLGVETTSRLGIVIIDDTSHMEVWTASADAQGKTSMRIGRLDMTIHPLFQGLHTAWKNKETVFSCPLAGEDVKAYYRTLNNSPDYPSQFNLDNLPKRQEYNSFIFPEGAIFIFSLQPLATEITQIFKKFAGVFGQTYRRYLDLQKAEAQARDAKIEASLERVRSKTMAMHNSQDVSETVAVMFDELVKLGVETTSRLGILIVDDTSHMEVWTASSDAQGKTSMRIGRLDMTIHPILQALHTAWKNKQTMFSYPLAGEDMKAYYRAINNSPDYPSQFNLDTLPKQEAHNSFLFAEGAIFIFSLQPLPEEITQIFKKFAGVFGQTYRRYLDLQKAETQAREAQIEASLERVRGKALAMYNSKDLSSTASLVFTELRKLGVNSKRCGVALLSKNSRHTQLYVATTTLDTDSLDLVGAIELSGHPSLEKQYESWLKNEDYFTVLKGEELKSYKELIYSMLPVPYDHTYHEEFGYYLAFSEGFLFSWAEKPFSEIEINILNRFKSIIDLTFRRYIELQNSEANAREAIRQSSLDRVRAEIASMRTTGDLDRITPLIWNELTTLGVPFIRCGVFIMDEPQQLIHTYLSTPDGKAIAAFQLPFNADTGNRVGHAALQGWRQKQAVTLHWTEEEFRNFSHSLMEQGEITSEENYLTEHPPSGLDLHFFPFLQGMLYAGNTEPLSDDDKDLVQSLADAFSTAYARYEDFNRLELAKQQVEHTLSDLKSAQTKLVQSEKMASLGELTAGIAHEIQNPLNFVNNFSEVNQEMIEELEEELNAGNIEEALALAADIKQNEQKINHHGKRADGIVKGMLEHSRTGGGEKMPINMNALADEFMRLSYHGLRAKDKVFNAEMITNFDPDLPKINVIGQDMGRVILNLFNNAFYAVNQKKKTADAAYRPEVSVTTSAENGSVSITVKDNGIGIPDAIKEKIMQPFFTTKPTGEGTGLGLSLTYDMVVKGHGGSIQVNSVEGEGSEFIISLPIN